MLSHSTFLVLLQAKKVQTSTFFTMISLVSITADALLEVDWSPTILASTCFNSSNVPYSMKFEAYSLLQRTGKVL